MPKTRRSMHSILDPAMATLSDAQIEQRLQGACDWRLGEDSSIVRELSFPDFAAAIAFVNRVAELAEAANHHPDILIHGWNKVRLSSPPIPRAALPRPTSSWRPRSTPLPDPLGAPCASDPSPC